MIIKHTYECACMHACMHDKICAVDKTMKKLDDECMLASNIRVDLPKVIRADHPTSKKRVESSDFVILHKRSNNKDPTPSDLAPEVTRYPTA